MIDANESGGGVAQRLGYADTPNVLDATERASAQVVICARSRRRRCSVNPVGFDVIAGLPADIAWTPWSSADAATLIEHAQIQWDIRRRRDLADR